MKRTKLLLGSLLCIVLSLVLTQVIASNRISTAGIELQKMQTELKNVKRENSLIREKIVTLSSLTQVASRAGELGFVEGKQRVYISEPLPLARNE